METGEYRVTSNLEEQAFEDIVRLGWMTDWAKDRHEDVIRKSVDHSLNFGVFAGERQVDYCRVITDYATFAYLADVIIEPEYRGLGLSKLMMESVIAHPELQTLRRFCLLTATAQGLYRKFGFENIDDPTHYMEIYNGEIVWDTNINPLTEMPPPSNSQIS